MLKYYVIKVCLQCDFFFYFKNGVFWINCVDCLDRINIVQFMVGKCVFGFQVSILYCDEILKVVKRCGWCLFINCYYVYRYIIKMLIKCLCNFVVKCLYVYGYIVFRGVFGSVFVNVLLMCWGMS